MEYNKRIFTFKEFVNTTLLAFLHMGDMTSARKSGLISEALQNHVMLAVTEVNGCAACAYAHSRHALEMGMEKADLDQLLSGSFDHMDESETAALLFAQHYAEAKGDFSPKAWQRIIETYGEEKAHGILAVIRGIMFGNAYGIAAGALWSRIKGKPVAKSRFLQEIAICFSAILLVPFALIRGLFAPKNMREA